LQTDEPFALERPLEMSPQLGHVPCFHDKYQVRPFDVFLFHSNARTVVRARRFHGVAREAIIKPLGSDAAPLVAAAHKQQLACPVSSFHSPRSPKMHRLLNRIVRARQLNLQNAGVADSCDVNSARERRMILLDNHFEFS
jgi:hypothetical protein